MQALSHRFQWVEDCSGPAGRGERFVFATAGKGKGRVVNWRIRKHAEVARCFRCQGYGSRGDYLERSPVHKVQHTGTKSPSENWKGRQRKEPRLERKMTQPRQASRIHVTAQCFVRSTGSDARHKKSRFQCWKDLISEVRKDPWVSPSK